MICRQDARIQVQRMSSIEGIIGTLTTSLTTSLTRYRASLLLAASLLLLGGAGGYGAAQLRQIISRQQRADAIAAVCATLQRQQYETLTGMVDPAPVAPTATSPFDQQAFVAQLRALDQQEGAVARCSWHDIQVGNETASYHVSLRRPRIPLSIGLLVVLKHEPDNGWRISRQSPFTSKPL